MNGLAKDSNDQVRQWVLDCLRQIGFEGEVLEPGDLGMGSHLEDDLGLDSIERVELVTMVSKKAGLPNGGVHPEGVKTLADLVRQVASATQAPRAQAG